MNNIKTILTANEIVGALDAMDVPFLIGGERTENALALLTIELIENLAQSSEARMQSALIPLLLRRPEYAEDARRAAARLNGQAVCTLELFYTAAMLLQRKYTVRLEHLFGSQPVLPDWFSSILRIELGQDVDKALARVGNRNTELSGLKMNWTGGYEHAAKTWLEYVELRAERKRHRTWQAH